MHLWRVDVRAHASTAATLAQSLAPDELERAARFRRRIDGQRYVIAHGALRDILARYVNGDSGGVVLRSAPGGKPELANNSLRFNMSRSRDLVVVAISATHVPGVDVELVRRGVAHELTRCFSPKAFALLELLPDDERTRAFFQAWTRMEAYAKAVVTVSRRTSMRWTPSSARTGPFPRRRARTVKATGGFTTSRRDDTTSGRSWHRMPAGSNSGSGTVRAHARDASPWNTNVSLVSARHTQSPREVKHDAPRARRH